MTQPNHEPPSATPVAGALANADLERARKKLVPLWIKIFGWVLIVIGAVIPMIAVVTVVRDQPTSHELFGLSFHGPVFHPISLLFIAFFLSLSASAYGLVFGKPWGLNACLITGYGGLALCLGSMAYSLSQGSLSLRLELLVQIPYLIKLHKIKPFWNSP
jgi:hypothetical protein